MHEFQNHPRYYILVGDSLAWRIALQNKMWGFAERTKKLWNRLNIGDYLAFYVIRPIAKIIGFGKITNKFIGTKLIWFDEKLLKEPFWRYRITFDIIQTVDKWENGIQVPSNIMLNTGRKVIDEFKFKQFISNAEQKWNTTIKLK